MTMTELSRSYEEAALLLRARLKLLRQKLADSRDPEENWHLKRRIAELPYFVSDERTGRLDCPLL